MLDYGDLRMRICIALTFIALTACGQPSDPIPSFELAARLTQDNRYPLIPADDLTPGATCKSPSEYRYPEHIPYCDRSVSSSTKNKVIRTYDSQLQYTIGSMPRTDFKIDHYIPLCMGGANDVANLWPQHKSVYTITDPLEPKLCTLLEQGTITQAYAIEQIQYAKHHLDEVSSILKRLDTSF